MNSFKTVRGQNFAEGGTLYQSRWRNEAHHFSGEDPNNPENSPVKKIQRVAVRLIEDEAKDIKQNLDSVQKCKCSKSK